MKHILFCFLTVILLSSHDMYLKLGTYFLEPNSDSIIELFNGTFERSENVITRDRMIDVSLVGNGERMQVDTSAWFEKEDDATYLGFTTGATGTWVAGVSTRPRTLGMSGEDFNDYLEHDGVLDMLESRRRNFTLADSAVERYSKHVKTVFQVGDERSDDYKVELGYPIEFVLLENPYNMHPGHKLPVKLLYNQQPLANQLVYVGSKSTSGEHTHDGETHSHDDNADHTHDELKQLRTDEEGMLNVMISSEGIWYLRTIHLVEVEEEGLTHESNWATISFAVPGGGEGHSHSHDDDNEHEHSHGDDHEHSHDDDHDHHHHDEGIPAYVYGILSILIVVVLFFWFNRKKKAE